MIFYDILILFSSGVIYTMVMRMLLPSVVIALTVSLLPSAAPAATGNPLSVIAKAMQAMGGGQRLQALTSISYTAVGERQMVEQSERPEGPYYLDHFTISEVRDISARETRIARTDEAYAADHWWSTEKPGRTVTIVHRNGSAIETPHGLTFSGRYMVQDDQEQAAFAPERLLFTAEHAPDLRSLPDAVIHGVAHHVLAFHWHDASCLLSINAAANLPWQITYTRSYPYDTFLSPWGDTTTTITYNAWSLEKYGISYPREWTYTRLGLPDMQQFIVALQLNPAVDQKALALPAAMQTKMHGVVPVNDQPLGTHGDGKPHELAPGILEYPGAWNAAFVKQRDGVVMIEAPWSTGYTKRLLIAARAQYHLPVKAVITTSDSWPHIAGVRQAVAEGIPVYALDLNRPILERLLAAPHRLSPDDLALHPRVPHFTFVTTPVTIGHGQNKIVIYPYRTASAERQMMVYFPHQRLLYTSDFFAPNDRPTDWFTPEYLNEALGAIAGYGLTPTTLFGMHYDATPFKTVKDMFPGR